MNELQAIQQIFKSSKYIHDLDFGEAGEFSAKAPLWGNDCDICLIYSHGKPKEEPNVELFSQAFVKIENALAWLDTNKQAIANHLNMKFLMD